MKHEKTLKAKKFKTYLEKRLDAAEIAEIQEAAKLEAESLEALQEDISKVIVHYMAENNLGFNDLVRKLGKSPTQVSKIIKGDANLTLTSIAELFAMMKRKPHLIAA